MYYIFDISLVDTIQTAFNQKKGDGFFVFSLSRKTVRQTNIPANNTTDDKLTLYRDVLILEIKSWADGDENLQAQAEQASEFYSNDNLAVIAYLNSFDVV